jgi:hypothetical protein
MAKFMVVLRKEKFLDLSENMNGFEENWDDAMTSNLLTTSYQISSPEQVLILHYTTSGNLYCHF